MALITDISNREHDLIRSIAGSFPRHPRQFNNLLEADAEIIRIKDSPDEYLIIKTDGIHEEIRVNLYKDPYLIGWMAVTAPVSDLAAVGVRPIGLVLSLVLPKHYINQWVDVFNRGVRSACEKYQTFILGGDTNFDESFSVSATAVAISTSAPVTRKGLEPGNNIYTTAGMGQGNAFAYSLLFDNKIKVNYNPVARLDTSKIISKYASACIDTSDGFFPALSVLSDINEVGFDISAPLVSLLSVDALKISQSADLPSWTMLAGPHG